MTQKYIPEIVPEDPADIPEFLKRELERISLMHETADDPHPMYSHLLYDSGWAGMRLTTDTLLTPGSDIEPYDTNFYSDNKLNSNLTLGEIEVPIEQGGGYQINIYGLFQAASNGGTFIFELLVDGVASLVSVANLSNQSDIGNFVMVGFFPIDAATDAKILKISFAAASSKNATMLDVVWTMVRIFPDTSALEQQLGVFITQAEGVDLGPNSLELSGTPVIPSSLREFNVDIDGSIIAITTEADFAVPTNWVTYKTVTIDPPLALGIYHVLVSVRYNMSVTIRAGLFRIIVNGVAQPFFEISAQSSGDQNNHISSAFFTSDGVTPHVIELQALVRGPGMIATLTISETKVRTFIEDFL